MAGDQIGSGPLPSALRDGFATAMGQSLLLPAGVLLIGFLAALLFARPRHLGGADPTRATTEHAPEPPVPAAG